MVKVDLVGMTEAIAEIGDLSRHTKSIIARTMTEAARDGKTQLEGWLPRLLDRPTPWTMRSLIVVAAEKEDLRAAVMFKLSRKNTRAALLASEPADSSIRIQTTGGRRPLKASEHTLLNAGISNRARPFLVPTANIKKDSYGNVSGATMNQVLYTAVARGSASKGVAKPLNNRTEVSSKKGQYFIMRGANAQAIGIAKNMGRAKPLLMLGLVADVTYRVRIPFDKIIQAEVERKIQQRFNESIDVVVQKYGYWRR